MIVYFNKKSKKITQLGIMALCLALFVYGLFVWNKILMQDISTIQIIRAETTVLDKEDTKLDINNVAEKNKTINEEYMFVASSRGKYYYPKTCSRAKSLSVQNMLYFKDKIDAEAAGYVAHLGC